MDLPLDEFLFVYKLCQVPKCNGWYFLGSYGRSKLLLGKLIKELPLSSHAWKLMFVMVKDMFDVHPADKPLKCLGVQTSFGMLIKYP